MRVSALVAIFAISCLALAAPQFAVASRYLTFDVPGACSAGVPYGINKWGSVTGTYTTCSGNFQQGFLYQPSGVITTFVVPGA